MLRLTLSSARPAEPALKYTLLPNMIEQTPGNAESMLYMVNSTSRGQADYQQMEGKVKAWLSAPVEELPRGEVDAWLAGLRVPLRYAELAARREFCHWDLSLRSEGVSAELPPLADYRQVAEALALRVRLALSERRFEDALHDIQTGLGLGRYVGSGPTVIQTLVGVAIVDVITDQLLNWMATENSPSLYWALVNLPRPIIAKEAGLAFEREWLFIDNPALLRLEQDVLSAGELERILARFIELFKMGPSARPEWKDRAAVEALIANARPVARQYLLAHGHTKEQLDRLLPAQVMLMHSVDRYRHWMHEQQKWMGLPYWQVVQGLRSTEEAMQQAEKKPEEGLFVSMLAAMSGPFNELVGLERKFTWLQFLEAVRVYAAAHEGRLPPSIEAISEIPVPLDPVTGEQFAVAFEGGAIQGELRGPLRLWGKRQNYVRYELRPATQR
ncbi:MAG: hypothetical protein AMXMBFR13_20860 [Phycisphaerae bacterium]